MNRSRFRGATAVLFGTLALLSVAGFTSPAAAQLGTGNAPPEPATLVKVAADPVTIPAGGRGEVVLTLTIAPTWHINANPPSPAYMIATEAMIQSASGVASAKAVYPPPHQLKVEFDEAPLAVFDGTARIRVPLTVSATAEPGTRELSGTLRFQACNDQVCLAPASIPFRVSVVVGAGGANPAIRMTTPEGDPGTSPLPPPPGSTDTLSAVPPPPGTGTTPTPLGRGVQIENPLARALESGSWTGWLTLFAIGLALNLTPCVYPMLGVTVSIFGARTAAPPTQVFGHALVYVLGIVLMYSVLGVGAALTGGMIGGALQSLWIQLGIAAMMAALALSMFGLYELQLPPALMQKLGGSTTTGIAGTFLSGLVVGIIAAPCVGPPVAALALLVGAKGDPAFGFATFFTLALGLGAPYLVLGTFSNLLQKLPRSGEWMVWVKKAMGVAMLALAAFYASLALAPDLVAWIAPVALLAGGLWLGFVDKSGSGKPGFRRLKYASGFVAAVLGVAMITSVPRDSIAFEPYTPAAVAAARQAGQPVMLDFTADWCAPCHELERFTFTDGRVREAAKRFRTLRLDLTRYDSPEAEGYRREFKIPGVPTVMFLSATGEEVTAARVTGFLPPDRFLERMHMATGEAPTAERD